MDVDLVTYGPGLHMLRADTSPVQDRIKRLKDIVVPRQDPVFGLQQHQAGHGEGRRPRDHCWCPTPPSLPSGVVHLMELQEQGWSYVRP